MNFEATVSIDDLLAFNQDYVEITFGRTMSRNRWLNNLASGLISGVLVGLLIARDSPLGGLVVGILVGVVTFLAFPAIQRDRVKKLVRKAYETTDDKTAIGLHRHSMSDDGIRTVTSNSESIYNWSAVQRIRIVSGRLFVYVGPNKALIIPLETLQGASTEEILESIRRYVPDVPMVGHEA